MAWPPTIPPNTRTNATITLDNHPTDHNQTSDALTETVTEVNLKAPKANPVFTGVVTLPAGTAAAPALTWTGDTNTGIYSDTADTIRFSTGGTLRMSIGATGIIGQVYTSDLATGTHAAGYTSSASFVTAVGYDAVSASSGTSQTAVGYQAGYQAAAGDYLTAVGHVSAYLATGDRISALGYGAGYAASGSDVVAVGSSALIGTAHSNVIGLGTNVVSTASNQMIVGVAGNAINTWVPGHDPDTYLDWATADTVKHYAGGVKVLEINETGSAPYMGFFGTAAVAKPTGVAVSAAGIHAALVTLGLIAA